MSQFGRSRNPTGAKSRKKRHDFAAPGGTGCVLTPRGKERMGFLSLRTAALAWGRTAGGGGGGEKKASANGHLAETRMSDPGQRQSQQGELEGFAAFCFLGRLVATHVSRLSVAFVRKAASGTTDRRKKTQTKEGTPRKRPSFKLCWGVNRPSVDQKACSSTAKPRRSKLSNVVRPQSIGPLQAGHAQTGGRSRPFCAKVRPA